MTKHFEVGEYTIEVNRQGSRSESEYSWTVYHGGKAIRSGRAPGPHEARAMAEEVCGVVPAVETTYEPQIVVGETKIDTTFYWTEVPKEPWPPKSRWQRFKDWLAAWWESYRWV